MGLDASVCCDCFERGRLRALPNPDWRVQIDPESGRRWPTNESSMGVEELIRFDRWNWYHACEHERGVLLHQRLGNISLVGLYRKLLKPYADQLPIVTTKIIFSGSHAGDALSLSDVAALPLELSALEQIHLPKSRDEELVRFLGQQLRELVAASKQVGKPIVF
jgi:hypothetical protein